MANFSRITFSDLRAQIDEFLAYLDRQRIRLHPASSFSKSVALARAAVVAAENQFVPDEVDPHEAISALGNVGYLARRVLKARGTGFEKQLFPLLQHLGSGDPSPLSPGERSEDRDKIFEAICGSTCAQFANDVRFVEPPDIICTFEAETWGIACKVAYGKPSTVVQAIRKGCRQNAMAGVSKGLVVVQATNLFLHEGMYAHSENGNVLSLREMGAQQFLFENTLRAATRPMEIALADEIKARGLPLGPTVGVAFVVQTLPYFRKMRSMMAGVLYCSLDRCNHPFVDSFNLEWQRL